VAEDEAVVDLYGASYGGFATELYAAVRREAWGEDVGQNSWLTRAELDRFAGLLALDAGSRLLEVACGSGGPALHLARATGCAVVGIDVHEDGVAQAARQAAEAGLAERARFVRADADEPLPFPDASFDAVLCIDAINHLRDRPRVLADWARLLAPGGRVLFTDPITVTGALGSDEIALRASIGHFVFVPPGEDERLVLAAGLRVLAVEDATGVVAAVADRWLAARAARAAPLRAIEGDATFEGQQRFLEVTATLARERRLSRVVVVAERPAAR
jgi:ubiquinone/menaquinone biosynthesis C-methylase UbiE